MLRRTFVVNLAPLALLMVCSTVAIWMLRNILGELDRVNSVPQVRDIAHEFRWVVFGMSIAFLLILNISVLIVLGIADQIERRRMETLQQVAVAINHELNNCVATIGLQLRLLDRRAGQSPRLSESLRQIDSSLHRITGAVQSLKNARRIVLTDYLPGTKMLDLQKCAADEPAAIS
jgi:signal transduction histidine kinase